MVPELPDGCSPEEIEQREYETPCLGMPLPDAPYPTVYASDLISFFPHPPSFTSEPAGAGLIGKPANFVATSTEHTLTGTLLGYPVAVAFIPTGYTFDYGDGTTLDSITGGALWSDTGDPQFTRTETSHVYMQRGTYITTATTNYAAYVNFGDGAWRPVIGEVYAISTDFPIRIYQPSTGLVSKDCNEDPSGPGC